MEGWKERREKERREKEERMEGWREGKVEVGKGGRVAGWKEGRRVELREERSVGGEG